VTKATFLLGSARQEIPTIIAKLLLTDELWEIIEPLIPR
jgi:hypothetical protein